MSEVAQTGEFQMWGSEVLVDVRTGASLTSSVLEPRLGQLVPVGAPGQPIGYFGIRQRIAAYLAHKLDESFAIGVRKQLEKQAELESLAGPASVLRIGRVSSAVAEVLADSVQAGTLDCVIGLDPTRPELSQAALFDAISEGPQDENMVRTDVQITCLLQPGERTGLFRRARAAPPAVHAGSEVASCYVRIDKFTPTICIDVLAAPGELGRCLDGALADLSARTLIEPAGDLVTQLLDGPFVVPSFLEHAGQDLRDARDHCSAREFYQRRRQEPQS
jgi:hypothetical protein